MRVFFSDGDREEYLSLLAAAAERFGVKFWAWCLMSNHVHFVAVPREADSLARTFGEAHRRYTRLVNFRQKVRGHLFQERFHSCPVQRDGHLLAAARYVETNPVKAGLVERAEEWPWSSAGFNAGRRRSDPLASANPLREMVGSWRRFLGAEEKEISEERIERHLRTGRPLGAAKWVRRLESRLERPLAPRRPGRPRKRDGGLEKNR